MEMPKGSVCHECAPKEWRKTPIITGSHELDAMIHRNGNSDLPARVKLFVDQSAHIYGPNTAYSGYSGYSGDA